MESLYYGATGWKFRFSYEDLIRSQNSLNGSYWAEWENIRCPVLLLKGGKSWVSDQENMEEMGRRNSQVGLIIHLDAGHAIHDDEREKFCANISHFIRS